MTKRKLSRSLVVLARRRVRSGESVAAIAASIGDISYSGLYAAVTGSTWSSVRSVPPVPGKLLRRRRPERVCDNCGDRYRSGGTTQRCQACNIFLFRWGREREVEFLHQGHHARLGRAEIEKLHRQYWHSGTSIETLAKDLPFSPETLRRRFRQAGLAIRPNAGKRARLTAAIVRAARERHSAGETISHLAKEYGINYQTLYSAVAGHTWRVSGGPLPGDDDRTEKQPCVHCDMLTAHPSGECRYCRRGV